MITVIHEDSFVEFPSFFPFAYISFVISYYFFVDEDYNTQKSFWSKQDILSHPGTELGDIDHIYAIRRPASSHDPSDSIHSH